MGDTTTLQLGENTMKKNNREVSHTRRRGERRVGRVGCGYGCQLAVGLGRLSLPPHVINIPGVSQQKTTHHSSHIEDQSAVHITASTRRPGRLSSFLPSKPASTHTPQNFRGVRSFRFFCVIIFYVFKNVSRCVPIYFSFVLSENPSCHKIKLSDPWCPDGKPEHARRIISKER